MEGSTEASKRCKRAGCGQHYTDETNNGTACSFHSGKPIFHDTRKGWDCCQQIVYDWDSFQQIKGCCKGPHTDQKQDTEFWKSSTVANAKAGLDKADAPKIKKITDFNKEEEAKAAEDMRLASVAREKEELEIKEKE